MVTDELKGNLEKHSMNYSIDAEKTIDFRFGNKIGAIYNFGNDLLFDAVPEILLEILDFMKNNPEMGFDTLSYVKYKDSYDFLLFGLLSYKKNLTVNIRVMLKSKSKEADIKSIMESIGKYYENAKYYSDRAYLKDMNRDVVIFSQIPETLDNFDIYLSLEDNIIKTAYLCNEISSFSQNISFKSFDMNKIIANINVLEYKAAVFPELCFCMGIENLLALKIPKRAVYIRMLLCELFRISSHLSFIVNASLIIGNQSGFNLTLIEREKVLNMIEMITGSRIIPNFIRIGGVKRDIDDYVLEMISESLPVLFKNIRKIEDSFSSDIVLLDKLKDIGSISIKDVNNFALTGPNLRASGHRYDLRKDPSYLLYKDFSFTIPLGRYGDNLDRVIIRFKEIYQSFKIINELIRLMPIGPVGKMISVSSFELEQSPIISSIESPHGLFKLYIEILPESKIEIIPIGSVSNSMFACEKALEGCSFDNLLTTITSFCIDSPTMY